MILLPCGGSYLSASALVYLAIITKSKVAFHNGVRQVCADDIATLYKDKVFFASPTYLI